MTDDFKIGDRVQFISEDWPELFGKNAVVTEIESESRLRVDFDDERKFCWFFKYRFKKIEPTIVEEIKETQIVKPPRDPSIYRTGHGYVSDEEIWAAVRAFGDGMF